MEAYSNYNNFSLSTICAFLSEESTMNAEKLFVIYSFLLNQY